MKLYRYTRQTRITNYCPIPRSVLELQLPSTAILLYTLLLDRATLSQKNDYADESGWIYVVYPREELAEQLSVSTRIISRYIGELEQAGLLKRMRRRMKTANRYYLYLPEDSVTGTDTGTNIPVDRHICSHTERTIVHGNNKKKQQDFNELYQHNEEESL